MCPSYRNPLPVAMCPSYRNVSSNKENARGHPHFPGRVKGKGGPRAFSLFEPKRPTLTQSQFLSTQEARKPNFSRKKKLIVLFGVFYLSFVNPVEERREDQISAEGRKQFDAFIGADPPSFMTRAFPSLPSLPLDNFSGEIGKAWSCFLRCPEFRLGLCRYYKKVLRFQ